MQAWRGFQRQIWSDSFDSIDLGVVYGDELIVDAGELNGDKAFAGDLTRF